jgi:hypothetical protein
MSMKRILPLIVAFTTSMSLAYFWEDWGKQTTPAEKMKKEEIDLKYRKKAADVDYKQQKATRESYEKGREKQQKLQHEKENLELNRKKDRLKVEMN